MTGRRADLFGIAPAALPAWHALAAALRRARVIPCAGREEWLSDDPAARAEAAEACRHCPALAECARFADANRETAGVWGGLDRTPAAGRPAQPKEHTA